ncbi:MAG: hypothetical protein R2822_00320 [Spirosomataceae bacterium]
MCGGLMTTHPSLKVKDPFKDVYYQEPSFEKAKAEGFSLAFLTLNALEKADVITGGISLIAKTIELPLENSLFQLGIALGVINSGYSRWFHFRTEIAAWKMGDVSFITIPGELYPEIANGGIETPIEGDFKLKKAVETPHSVI